MKKTLALLFALIILAGALGACRPADDPDDGPDAGPAPTGDVLLLGDFEAGDLDGNPVTQAVFAQADLTMINIWGTFCNPCIAEMPDLGALHEEYSGQDFQVIGIVGDLFNRDGTLNEDQVALARKIAAGTGANYPHLIPAGSVAELVSAAYAVPTTYFVNSGGIQIGEPYIGAKSRDDWQAVIDALLAEAQQ